VKKKRGKSSNGYTKLSNHYKDCKVEFEHSKMFLLPLIKGEREREREQGRERERDRDMGWERKRIYEL